MLIVRGIVSFSLLTIIREFPELLSLQPTFERRKLSKY